MENPQTIPQHFLHQVARFGDKKVALRQKEFGIWREFNWQESYEQVRDFGLGLIQLGLNRGDKVATVGDNDRQIFVVVHWFTGSGRHTGWYVYRRYQQ